VRDAHDSGELVARKVGIGILVPPLPLLLGGGPGPNVGSPSEEAAAIWFEQAGTSVNLGGNSCNGTVTCP